jgi:hypothetical protein
MYKLPVLDWSCAPWITCSDRSLVRQAVPWAPAFVPGDAALTAEAGALAETGAPAEADVDADAPVLAAAPACVELLLHPASDATVRTVAAEVPNASFTVFMCSPLFVTDPQSDNLETPVGSARLGIRPTNSGMPVGGTPVPEPPTLERSLKLIV